MGRGLLFASALLLAWFFASLARAQCEFPVPDFKVYEFMNSGISHAQFDTIMDRVEARYAATFRRLGVRFVLHRSWADSTVNAQAWCDGSNSAGCAGGTCHIEMFGGLARYSGMTPNGMALIAGHEIGHCLGGYPFYPQSNMAVEGQADYYGTAIALPRLGLGPKNASRVVADTLASLSGEPKTSLPGPYLQPVSHTYAGHPAAQCRRVTYEAGRVHNLRPNCWYAGAPFDF